MIRFNHSPVIKSFYQNHCAVFIGAYAYDKLMLFGDTYNYNNLWHNIIMLTAGGDKGLIIVLME